MNLEKLATILEKNILFLFGSGLSRLGYNPHTSFEEGIQKFIDWLQLYRI